MFPNRKGKCHSAAWGGYFFRIIWSKVSNEKACEYDLRSLYAVKTSPSGKAMGMNWAESSFSSRSMGHRNIQNTFGYFHLTPMLKLTSWKGTHPKASANFVPNHHAMRNEKISQRKANESRELAKSPHIWVAFDPHPVDKNRQHTYLKIIQDGVDHFYEISYGREVDNAIHS